jgi:uncharacterized membrane protein YhhN
VTASTLRGASAPRTVAPLRWLALAATLSLALHLRAEASGPPWQVYLFKPLTTLLVLSIAMAARGTTRRYQGAVVAGLGFSLVGDAMLMLPGDRFVAGLAAFLVAHLAYLAAFTDRVGVRVFAWPTVAYLAAGGSVLALLWDRLGAMRLPVLAYMLVIMAMAAQAAGRALRLRTPSSWAAAAGAAVFVVSDASLAVDRFRGAFPFAGVLVMTTYVAAQLLIASSANDPKP